MADAKHTPGPWQFHRMPDGRFLILNGNMNIAGTAHEGFGPNDDAIEEANARLIASAPETAAERDRLAAEVERLKKLTTHSPPACQTSTPAGNSMDCNWPNCDCLPRGEWAELILNEHAQEVALEDARKLERLREVNAGLVAAAQKVMPRGLDEDPHLYAKEYHELRAALMAHYAALAKETA